MCLDSLHIHIISILSGSELRMWKHGLVPWNQDTQSGTGVLMATGSADRVGVDNEHVEADMTDN